MAPESHPYNRDDLVLSTKKKEDRRVAVGTLVGTAVEWYDFFIYANAAAIVFAPLFFDPFIQSSGEVAGRLISFATVGISFFFRPLGAAVAGHYGDRIGRKAMLVATLLLMGVATFVIGLLPTYHQVGVIAPISLIILRVLQGFAAGGEWGGAALMAVEHAPVKKRGLFGGFPQIGVPLGMLMATVVLSITSAVTSDDQFMSWGWRVPFLFSIVLIGIGMAIRLGVSESPVMEEIREADEKDEQVRLPIVEMFRTAWKPLVQSALIFAGNGVAGYMITGGFILSYTTQDKGLDRDIILNLISAAAVVWIISTIFSAWLSDYIGRKKTYMIGFVIQLVWVWVLFQFLETGNYTLIGLGMMVWAIPIGFTYGPQAAMFAEMFPAKIRYSGAGLGNAFGAILGGAFAPLIATYLVAETGTTRSVAVYITIVTLVAVAALLWMKDRTGRDLSPAADAELNEKIEKIAAEEEGVIETTFDRGAGF
ncbi:MFS transporter [Trueperella bialowiezensis]|uniref:Inner membrane metabolite transport protein yhjE n=1 Tax=Trueperella bialowiezensis TaxID=312285 RepID=A0A448PER9_9ACTO|nr:MFS transporter [Trueperella bialowiezensis]VEI13433.1 Inner membrane metabolite transport protein yhjE [Trueperella bialowiezensis]